MIYHIKQVTLDEQGTIARFLATESDRDFWSDWEKKKNTKDVAKKFAILYSRILKYGIQWAITACRLTVIRGDVHLMEIKGFYGVQRVACYFHHKENANTWVLIESFRGHQGSNKIEPSRLERLIVKAAQAKKLIEKEQLNDDSV